MCYLISAKLKLEMPSTSLQSPVPGNRRLWGTDQLASLHFYMQDQGRIEVLCFLRHNDSNVCINIINIHDMISLRSLLVVFIRKVIYTNCDVEWSFLSELQYSRKIEACCADDLYTLRLKMRAVQLSYLDLASPPTIIVLDHSCCSDDITTVQLTISFLIPGSSTPQDSMLHTVLVRDISDCCSDDASDVCMLDWKCSYLMICCIKIFCDTLIHIMSWLLLYCIWSNQWRDLPSFRPEVAAVLDFVWGHPCAYEATMAAKYCLDFQSRLQYNLSRPNRTRLSHKFKDVDLLDVLKVKFKKFTSDPCRCHRNSETNLAGSQTQAWLCGSQFIDCSRGLTFISMPVTYAHYPKNALGDCQIIRRMVQACGYWTAERFISLTAWGSMGWNVPFFCWISYKTRGDARSLFSSPSSNIVSLALSCSFPSHLFTRGS